MIEITDSDADFPEKGEIQDSLGILTAAAAATAFAPIALGTTVTALGATVTGLSGSVAALQNEASDLADAVTAEATARAAADNSAAIRVINLESSNFALPPGPSTIAGLAFWAEASASLAMEGAAVTTWPDLSGNSRPASSSGVGRSPLMRTTGGPLGQPWLDFSAAGGAAQMGTPSWSRGTDSTVFVVARINTFAAATDGVLIGAGYEAGGIPMGVWQNSGTNNGNIFAFNGAPVQITGLRMLAGQWALFEMVFSTTAGSIRINGDPTWQATGSTGTGFTPMGLSIGNRGPTTNTAWRGGIAAVAVYDGVLSDSNRSILRTYFSKKYLGLRQVLADGDSITEASPYSADDWPTVANGLMTRPSYIINSGTGGQKLSTAITNAPSQIDSKWNPDAVQKICVIYMGTNDYADGSSDDVIYDRIVTYCTERKAAQSDAKVMVATLLPRGGYTFAALNARIRANYTAFADCLADLGVDTIMGNPASVNNLTWYQADLVHPTAAGRARLGVIFADALNAVSPSSDVAARALYASLATESAARLAAQSALAALRQPPALPAWDTGLNSGTLTGAAFSAVWNSGGGTLRISGSRPTTEGSGEIFALLDSGGIIVGPAVFDNAGVIQVRIRSAASADLIAYNLAARSVPQFDLVIDWSTSAAADRHMLWINGVLQNAAAESAGALATTQNQLRWGASNLTIKHLAYYTTRLGTPNLIGSLSGRAGTGLALPTIRTESTTVAALPSAAAAGNGARGYVSDATLAYTGANQGSAAVGGGSNHTSVIVINGAWVIGG